MRLSLKLPLAFAGALTLLFAAGVFGILQLNTAISSFTDGVLHHVAGVQQGAEISAHFSTAVQEWKNVLLRGKDATEMQKYWEAHVREMGEAEQHTLALGKALEANSTLRINVDQLAVELTNAEKGYEHAFEAYRSAGNDFTAGDAAAKGIDRGVTQSLQELRAELSKNENHATEAAIDGATIATRMSLLVMTLVSTASLAASLWLTRRITAPISAAIGLAKMVAHGDLTTPIHVTQTDEVGDLLESLRFMQNNLSQLVTDVRHGSDTVANASAEISTGNTDLGLRIEQQASALQQTSASMDTLGNTVTQNAESARRANQLAQSASTIAEEGGRVVAQVVDTMRDINESSRKISDIIGVIDGIAFQTNILALNAAVEAARAGEQGRGFAVVASEVRSLAGRSADAAKEIKNLIHASVERVTYGSDLVDQAGVTMTEVVTSIKMVTDIVSEISAASGEQASGVAQVGQAIAHMDQATQQNAALVEEMTAATGSLLGQARALVHLVDAFKVAGLLAHPTAPTALLAR